MRLMQNEPGRRGSRPSKDRKQPIVVFFGGPGFPPAVSGRALPGTDEGKERVRDTGMRPVGRGDPGRA